jgi:hypothetical protein
MLLNHIYRVDSGLKALIFKLLPTKTTAELGVKT